MTRPGPLMWLRYAFTLSLPERYATWIWHDTTCGTWFLRHVLRVLTWLVVPEALLVVILPAGAYLRALTAFVTGACALLLMSILASDAVERVSQRAGNPWGSAERRRAERAVETQRRQAAAYRERVARRRR